MTAEEIYELARKRQPAPDDMTLPEQLLYTVARNIYQSYKDGIIGIEQAKREKINSIRNFESLTLKHDIYDDHMKRMVTISQALGDVEKNGCERCKRAVRVFDGREPVRDTSDKIYGILVEIIRKAKQDYSQDYTDHTEDDYIAEAIMDAGFFNRVEVQE